MVQTRPAHIVIIEDNPADERLLRLALDQQGEKYTLSVLEDGEQAIRYVQQQRATPAPTPCVIVLDLHLPKYDGLAVLREIKAAPTLAHINVIVLTGMVHPDEARSVQELGACLYQAKPPHLDDFLRLGQQIFAICRERADHVAV